MDRMREILLFQRLVCLGRQEQQEGISSGCAGKLIKICMIALLSLLSVSESLKKLISFATNLRNKSL